MYLKNLKLVELSFTDKDHAPNGGKYTFLEGDFVNFRIATDKRIKTAANRPISGQQRATQLTLIEEYSLRDNSVNTNEHRENGVLVEFESDVGVIKCVERDELVFFQADEVINFVLFNNTNDANCTIQPDAKKVMLEIGDSLEFSVTSSVKDSHLFSCGGLRAIRLIKLPKDSVQFEVTSSEQYIGYVEREPLVGDEKSYGCIRYEFEGEETRILFNYKSHCDEVEAQSGGAIASGVAITPAINGKQVFYNGDKVQFNVLTCLRTNIQYAVNVKLVETRKEIGYITMLKDNYGFIELDILFDTVQTGNKIPKDIFFHYRLILFYFFF